MDVNKVKSLLSGMDSRILHIGCGDGSVSEEIAGHLKSQGYGIETDRSLAGRAATKIRRVLKGCRLGDVRISPCSFGMVILEYGLSGNAGKEEDDTEAFLRASEFLAPSGVMLVNIGAGGIRRFARIANSLVYRYGNITVLPENNKDKAVILGEKKQSPLRNKRMECFFAAYAQGKASLLPMEYTYAVKPMSGQFTFVSTLVTPEDMKEELKASSLTGKVKKDYLVPPTKKVLRCLVPPSIGHLAKIAANGDMDGLAEKDGQRILSKGFVKRIEKRYEYVDPESGDTVQVSKENIEVYINAFDLSNGNLIKTRLG